MNFFSVYVEVELGASKTLFGKYLLSSNCANLYSEDLILTCRCSMESLWNWVSNCPFRIKALDQSFRRGQHNFFWAIMLFYSFYLLLFSPVIINLLCFKYILLT